MQKNKPKTHGFNCDNATKEQHHFYTTFEGIRGRCNRKSQIGYKNYGGRGIKCMRKTFGEFINDMRDEYIEHTKAHGIKNTTIDRIDVNGHYCKDNCRWITHKENCSTKRDTLFVEIDGEIWTSRRLADIIGICHQGANNRLRKYRDGIFTKEQVFLKEHLPMGIYDRKPRKTLTINGKIYTSKIISDMCNIGMTHAQTRMRMYREGKIGVDELLRNNRYL